MSCNCETQPEPLANYDVGTTWCGLSDVTLTPAIEQPLESVSVAFIKGGTTIQTLTNGDGVTITDAANWIFDIDAQVLTITAGYYTVEITTTDSTGYIREFPTLILRAI